MNFDFAKEIFRLDDICPSRLDRIVAVEVNGDSEAEIFVRGDDSVLRRSKINFTPFIMLERDSVLGSREGVEFCALRATGGGRTLASLAKFASLNAYKNAILELKKTSGFGPTAPNAPYRIFSDLVQQCLILEQIRFFRGMSFREIRRLQFDIETLLTDGYDFPNPERPNDKIAMICLRDNTGWEKTIVLDEAKGGEKALLEDFIKTVNERDPDLIEGYNMFRFDLPFIEKKAAMHKVKVSLGRDGSLLRSRASRVSFAERTMNYTRYDAYGRHFADIYFMVQFYDISHRNLEDFNLKSVAIHLGVAAKNRTYVEHGDITDIFRQDPMRLASYCMDDVRETNSISEMLSPSYFYQSQILPFSYQNCIVKGNATKIDALLVSEYLNLRHAVPYSEQARNFEGGLTDAFESGVFENVWHCDIRSLYPSILLAGMRNPSRDKDGVFMRLLTKLRDFRFLAKNQLKSSSDKDVSEFYDALQGTFKILINSFYGYLGFAQGTFNDYALAAAVTATGRQILSSMTDFLREVNAKVIEIDTDGIYFQPPHGIISTDEMQVMIQSILPKGIDVELDNIYKSMFCYKSKNYALLGQNEELSLTGAALKSRGLEPFQREYMKIFMEKLLKKDYEGIRKLSEDYRRKIESREFSLAKFAKTETLQESLESYSKKIANGSGRRSAAYELALRANRKYKQGDQIAYYVVGTKAKVSVVDSSRLLKDASAQRDENTEYYLAKFAEMEKKFSKFLPKNESVMKEEDDLFLVS